MVALEPEPSRGRELPPLLLSFPSSTFAGVANLTTSPSAASLTSPDRGGMPRLAPFPPAPLLRPDEGVAVAHHGGGVARLMGVAGAADDAMRLEPRRREGVLMGSVLFEPVGDLPGRIVDVTLLRAGGSGGSGGAGRTFSADRATPVALGSSGSTSAADRPAGREVTTTAAISTLVAGLAETAAGSLERRPAGFDTEPSVLD